MRNPFVYGSVVTGRDFADRKEEIASLVRDMKDRQRVFLISPRRYGKTSLVINVLARLRRSAYYTAYIDLYRVTSVKSFFEMYANAVVSRAETKLEKAVRLLGELLPGIRPKITIEQDGKAVIGVEYIPSEKELAPALKALFNLPERLASRRKKHFVVAIDEFQEIRELDGERMEKAMRAAIQHQKNVGYLFAGSKKSIIHDMVNRSDGAFYRMGRTFNLKKMPRDAYAGFILRRFRGSGIEIEEGTVRSILDVTEDCPYYAQYLCHELWDRFRDRKLVKEDDILPALDEILSEETPLYVALWDGMTLHQRRTLKAIATHGGKHVFSNDFVTENELGPSSTLQTTLHLLQKKQVVDKDNGEYIITDVFFKDWIRRKIA